LKLSGGRSVWCFRRVSRSVQKITDTTTNERSERGLLFNFLLYFLSLFLSHTFSRILFHFQRAAAEENAEEEPVKKKEKSSVEDLA
jgi:hypothetical protein